MRLLLLPCPHCAAPIEYRWREGGPGRGAVDGICPACLKPYRFGAGARFAQALSWIMAGLLAAAIYLLLQRCAVCERWSLQPLLALTPVLLVAAALLAGFVAGALGVRFHVMRCLQRGRAAVVLEGADEDIELASGRMPARPGPALLAAIGLLAMLAWAVALEVQALRAPAVAVPAAAQPASVADPLTFWLVVALDVLLLVLVLGCAIAVVRRRVLAGRGPVADSGATPDGQEQRSATVR